MIPAPIVQSTYGSALTVPKQISVIPRSTPADDRQQELEADLQFLLDAQAEGLDGSLNHETLDERGSTGSTTPTAHSVRSATSGSRGSRPRRRPGIRSARKGIYNSILALSDVKAEEINALEDEMRVGDANLNRINDWEEKKHKLEDASRDVGSHEAAIRSQLLRQEANVLQKEIDHVELQLADMKLRHKKLLKEVATAENAVQASLATYESSLRLLEADVRKYLATGPEASPGVAGQEHATVWQLPSKRRTLSLAKRHWTEQRAAVAQQCESAELEKTALDEGASLWKNVVVDLTEFERSFRADAMRSVNLIGETSVEDPQTSEELLQRMDTLIGVLEHKLDIAVARGWNLLIAAIGAEVDALRHGRRLLSGDQALKEAGEQGQSSQQSEESIVEPADEIRGLDTSFDTVKRSLSNGHEPESDSPDPELLFSKHESDSE